MTQVAYRHPVQLTLPLPGILCPNPCRALQSRISALTKLKDIQQSRQLVRGRYAFYGPDIETSNMSLVVIDPLKKIIEVHKVGPGAYTVFQGMV